MIPRPLYAETWDELVGGKAMVFLAGPRQAGKTTLARSIADGYANRLYLNWDDARDRAAMIRDPYGFEKLERRDGSTPLVVFDEIHKHRDWKNYLKGVYDRFHGKFRFLVTGSGRLDTWRRGGDSLAGRYVLFHLWPFTLGELCRTGTTLEAFRADPLAVAGEDQGEEREAWDRLARYSGFPEPWVQARPAAYRRWSEAYHSQLIREDIRDLTGIASVGDVETLYALLPERVGSLLSIPALAEDLRVAYNTLRNWLGALERLYLLFTIGPWTRRVVRATHKPRKAYLFDHGRIENAAARFENRVAVELFRAVSTWNDRGLGRFSLHYVRNKEKEETDFLLAEGGRPILLVEAKMDDTEAAPALRKFQIQIGVPAVQLTDTGEGFRRVSNGPHEILICPAHRWVTRLG